MPDRNAELKPCPFCGSKRISVIEIKVIDKDNEQNIGWQCFCDGCKAIGPAVFETSEWGKQYAALLWDFRRHSGHLLSNEDWFCFLDTETKAKYIAKEWYCRGTDWKYSSVEEAEKVLQKWLKGEHRE